MQLCLHKLFERHDVGKKGSLHAHEIAALLERAVPASIAPERYKMVLTSYKPPNGGVTWAGGNVTYEVRMLCTLRTALYTTLRCFPVLPRL